MLTQLRLSVVVVVAGVGGLLLILAAAPALAHHAFSAEFDASSPVELRGTVTKMEWINPHSWMTIEVERPDGTVETWEIEAGAPNAMFRRGFTRDSLPVGTDVVVNGYRAKDGGMRANGRDITLSDGQRLFVGSSGTGAPEDDRDPSER
jgi:hypothetical protein